MTTKEKYMEFVAQRANKHDDNSIHVAIHFNGAHDIWPLIEPLLEALKQHANKEKCSSYECCGECGDNFPAEDALAEFDKAIGAKE